MALEDYDLASKLQPQNAFAHFNRATILLRLNRPGEAAKALDRAIGIEKIVEFYRMRAIARRKTGDFMGAAADVVSSRQISGAAARATKADKAAAKAMADAEKKAKKAKMSVLSAAKSWGKQFGGLMKRAGSDGSDSGSSSSSDEEIDAGDLRVLATGSEQAPGSPRAGGNGAPRSKFTAAREARLARTGVDCAADRSSGTAWVRAAAAAPRGGD